MTAIDTSRQLLTTYQGVNLKFPIQEKLKVELGHVSKNSPRNEEDFYKFSYTQKGIKHYSDGLDYLNLSYDVNKGFNINYYYGHLENLYDKHYLGVEHQYPIANNIALHSKLRYFNSQDNSSALDIDS